MSLELQLIDDIAKADIKSVGGKAKSLALLAQNGVKIPFTTCINTDFYRYFFKADGFSDQIRFELGRKDFADMRWEEIWDCSLRIRNLFLQREMPKELTSVLAPFIEENFAGKKTAIRSSSPAEDSSGSSFAGLHESYINISGTDEILRHIKLVWLSLWSDAALLYRKELNLDIFDSAMAVVIQEVVNGEASGIAFTKNPNDSQTSVIEAVLGLNQGLVDGTIEPDRWIIDRRSGDIKDVNVASKDFYIVPAENGVTKITVPANLQKNPVLQDDQVSLVYNQAILCEKNFNSAQDMEWTINRKDICVLQSRPITTLKSSDQDDRTWYLSLRRSFENLEILRDKIVKQLIPAMIKDAESLDYDLAQKTVKELIKEIKHRKFLVDKWNKVYWDEFIPFAHGIRIFGQFYNDHMRPEDPYEFVQILQNKNMLCIKRNELLEKMASIAQNNTAILTSLKNEVWPDFNQKLISLKEEYDESFGHLSAETVTDADLDERIICNTVLQLATNPKIKSNRQKSATDLEDAFLSSFKGKQLDEAKSFLELGRCSYQLRDDDNVYLGRIENQFIRALRIAKKINAQGVENKALKNLIKINSNESSHHHKDERITKEKNVKDRQIVGQPAGPGLVTGKARVIYKHEDLKDFQQGEILVCDAINPNMTFIVPLASGIIERRGGMLIHGAIIAREYGIACVTGIPNAIDRIKTGNTVTVDGYLGLVTIGETADCFKQ